MTTFEQIQRQLWDSLMDHERRVFLQLIQDELPTLTLRELGEILTSPAARSVGALPVSSLLGGAAAPEVTRPAAPARGPRRAAGGRVGDRSVDSPSAPRPRLRQVSAPQSPVSAGGLAEAQAAAAAAARALEAPAPEARPEPSAADPTPRAARSEASPRRPRPEPAQLEIAPVADRSNVDVVRSAMNRTLAQHNRFDPDALVMNALRSTGEPIRAKDLRPRVGLQPDDLRAVLNRLVKAGAVRREGEGPDTVYQVFTAASAEASAPLAQ